MGGGEEEEAAPTGKVGGTKHQTTFFASCHKTKGGTVTAPWVARPNLLAPAARKNIRVSLT